MYVNIVVSCILKFWALERFGKRNFPAEEIESHFLRSLPQSPFLSVSLSLFLALEKAVSSIPFHPTLTPPILTSLSVILSLLPLSFPDSSLPLSTLLYFILSITPNLSAGTQRIGRK